MRDNIGGGALTETTLLILLAVCGTPRHGYGILQFIRQATNERVVLGAGTLYGALSTLERKGWIAPAEERDGKKEYRLTAPGREAVDRELERLRAVTALAERITEGAFDRQMPVLEGEPNEQTSFPLSLRFSGRTGAVAEQNGGSGLAAEPVPHPVL